VNRTFARSPVNLGVATFDGLNAVGYPYNFNVSPTSSLPADYLTSKPIDLSAASVADSAYLSFYFQAEGFGEDPDQQDSLILQFHIPAWGSASDPAAWRTQWFSEGFNPASGDSSFTRVMFRLDSASYFVKGFRFRFRNYATHSGNLDHWHLDEVRLDKNRSYTDTLLKEVRFVYQPPSFITEWRAMPWFHYKPALHMIPNAHLFIRNNDTFQHDLTYTYAVRDRFGALVTPAVSNPYSAANIGNPIQPFYDNGYFNFGPISDPAVAANVNFTGSLSDSTYFTVDHTLAPDIANEKDSMRGYQRFYNYYAYDDGTAEAGYGFVQQPFTRLAYKFTLPPGETETLKAIQMYFNPMRDDVSACPQPCTFQLMVWGDNGGQPGSVLFQQQGLVPDYAQQGYNRFMTYLIDTANVVVSGTFYIGYMQDGATSLNLGMDLNTNQQFKIFYNSGSGWINTVFQGALMLRPVLRDVYDVSGVEEENVLASFELFPNPAQDEVFIKTEHSNRELSVSLFDVSGRLLREEILQQNRIDVSQLQNGIYLFRLRDTKSGTVSTKRVVIAR